MSIEHTAKKNLSYICPILLLSDSLRIFFPNSLRVWTINNYRIYHISQIYKPHLSHQFETFAIARNVRWWWCAALKQTGWQHNRWRKKIVFINSIFFSRGDQTKRYEKSEEIETCQNTTFSYMKIECGTKSSHFLRICVPLADSSICAMHVNSNFYVMRGIFWLNRGQWISFNPKRYNTCSICKYCIKK